MELNRIFWLEDHPDILDVLVSDCGLELGLILDRITFAHDFETGREITSQQEFDLYILDADFPNRLGRDHLREAEQYLRLIRAGRKGDHISASSGKGVNNFARFYHECLRTAMGRKVVFSASGIAQYVAYHMDLPIYVKGSIGGTELREKVQRSEYPLERLIRFLPEGINPRGLSAISDWECGNARDFVQRYFL